MKLKHLIKGLEIGEIRGSKEVEITGISADSRTLTPGNLFIARKGSSHDGAQFIRQAVAAGAAAIATDIYDPFLQQTQWILDDPGKWMARIAARYYGNPSKELFVAGVTGTKGKTTTAYLVKHLLDGLGKPSGLIGTVETVVGPHRFFSTLTTHDAIANQKLLREMAAKECKAAVLEVSSHGLAQGRVGEIEFDVGIFTNLYPDHLDYHANMEEYAAAKRKLFDQVGGRAILNADSEWFPFMQQGIKGERLTFGTGTQADLRADGIAISAKGTEFRASYQGETARFRSPLIGRYNVYNLLAAAAVGIHLGAPLEKIGEILASFDKVPGRLEAVPNGRGISIFVDYAHNGEALDNVLRSLREIVGEIVGEIAEKKIIAVFGCGGNRDPGRRVGMGAAADKWADLAIITSDNPRGEDPQEICRQILAGFRHPEKAQVELDRKKAIERALALAQEGDIVLIAGKGHEKVQIFATQTLPFDDVEVAKEALQNALKSDMLAPS